MINKAPISWSAPLVSLCIAMVLAALVPFESRGLDFNCIWLGARNILAGQSPYTTSCYVYPVWMAIAALPLALIQSGPAYHLYLIAAFTSIFLALLSFRRWRLALLLGIPLIVITWLWGNIDWLVIVGFVLPFPIALPFLLAKPQLGFVLAALLVWQTWKRGRYRIAFGASALIGLGFSISFALGMSWGGAVSHAAYVGFNLADALFPWCIPLGLMLAVTAFKRSDRVLAMLSAVCLSPYVGGTAPLLIQSLLSDVVIF